MATKEAAQLTEESRMRDLFNALRTGELGVSLEALAQTLYFLQHAEFTLFDVKDAFRSTTGANERFLAYREFQIALGKIARVRYYGNCGSIAELAGGSLDGAASPKKRPRPTELELVCSLVNQLTYEHNRHQLDTLRCHMTRSSALDTLEHNLPVLGQSFQLYGSQNRLSTNITTSTITLDGFVDFLNAYFEYEEFFSFSDLESMSVEVTSGFASANAESKEGKDRHVEEKLNFAQFLELFCRVASAFHHKLLVQEGAQLRRAVESCRLEFSIEELLDHMHITLIPNDDSKLASVSNHQEITTQSPQTPRGDEIAALKAIVQNIRDVLQLDAADHATAKKPKYRIKREGSLVMQSSLSRRPSSNPADQESARTSTHSAHFTKPHQLNSKEDPKPLPQVAMIREVVTPPTLPADVIQQLESALKFQNLGQCNMALSALDSCRQHFQKQLSEPTDDDVSDILDPIQVEVHLFFALQAASIYDSAHRDAHALTKYCEAMKVARQLPASHPGRLLAKSCAGVTLFYAGELALAQQCHQLVLDARKITKSSGVKDLPDTKAAAKTESNSARDLVDTASAMNNLACCFSQDLSASASKSLDSAYLLFKHARQIYADAFGPAHPRVGLISRNLDRVRACQDGVVSDAAGALARGEYAHVIPGSRFQIKALEYVAKPSSKGSSKAGAKKKKKGAK